MCLLNYFVCFSFYVIYRLWHKICLRRDIHSVTKKLKDNMKNSIKIILTLLSLFTLKLYAAETDPNNSGTISGRIIDNNTAQPIMYASVALVNESDKNIITGVITDDNGSFQLSNIPYGKYNLKVSFVGYKPSTLSNIELSRQNRKVDLPVLKLSEDVAVLQAAVITQERLKGEEKFDRTVFILSDEIRKASSSGLDVLKHIPSVSVDFMENVTLEGQSNIQFYVDGVLRNKDFIAQLSPELIDKIELVTNPGVKYDSDISGVINIVLKKVKRYGINGSFTVPVSHPDKLILNPKANLEYGNQNFRIYVGDRMHLERFHGTETLTTQLDESYSNPYYFEKIGKGINSWKNNYMNYGIDWFINDKTSLNFMGEWRNYTGKTNDYLYTNKTFENDVLTEFFKTNKDSKDQSSNYYYSLFFKRKIDKEGNELTAEAYLNKQSGITRNDYSDTYFEPKDLSTIYFAQYRNDYTNNSKNNTELKLNYTFIFKNLKNDLGVRTYMSWMNNDFTNNFSSENITGETTDNFQYQENRQAAYYNLSGKVKKFSWQMGIRGEYSYININDNSNSDYFVLLPQVSLNQSFKKDQSVKFSYRKQIYRPNIGSLNPFETWSDSLHLLIGNPDLEPTIENRFELSYSKNFKSNYLSPKIYFRTTNNAIQDITTINDEGVTVITQDNIGNNMEYGIGLSTALQLAKKWKFNANFTLYNRIYGSNQVNSSDDKEENLSYRFNFSNIVSLPKDFNFMIFGNYGSPSISYQRTFSRDLLVLFGVQKKISDKANIEAYYNPILRNFNYSKVVTRTPGSIETWSGEVEVFQIFGIEFTYNFNYGSKVKKINRSAEYEREEGKGGM